MFKVGQKVVCVKQFIDHFGETLPIKGDMYTVREILTVENLCIRLEEIVNVPRRYPGWGVWECAFNAAGFRPVDTSFGEEVCESLEVITEPELV